MLLSAVRNEENEEENIFNDSRKSEELYQKAQFCDILILFFAIFGTILCYFSVLFWANLSPKYNLEFVQDYSWKLYAYLYANNLLTIFSWLLVCMREKMLLQVKKNEGFCDQNETLITSNRYKVILIEWAFLAVHPQSFLIGTKREIFNRTLYATIYYHWNDYLNLLSIFKNAYILKLLLQRNFSGSSRTRRIW